LKELAEEFKKDVPNIPINIVCRLINAMSDLPASFYPELKVQLIKRLYSIKNAPVVLYREFPHRGLSN